VKVGVAEANPAGAAHDGGLCGLSGLVDAGRVIYVWPTPYDDVCVVTG
jgi:hypothetical protein